MLKKTLLILFTGIISFSCSHSKEEKKPVWNNSLSVEENIAAQALAFDNDSTFPFLDEIMKNRSVLFLGEGSHSDMATIQIKVNMVEYLDNKDIHSVLFEMAPFISSYVFSCPDYDDFTKDWNIQSFFGMWLGIKPFQPLFEKIKNRQIKVFGIDSHAGIDDIKAAQAILHKYSLNEPFDLDWSKLDKYYVDRLVFWKEI
ncbi:MAG: hypothetical protein LBN11_05045, partial [Tannerella sp.]|nr:hypothetical protein [Tannerella sp.]